MTAIEEVGFSPKEADILNNVRLHQQVVFESDVFGADGRSLDTRYLRKWRGQRNFKLVIPKTIDPKRTL